MKGDKVLVNYGTEHSLHLAAHVYFLVPLTLVYKMMHTYAT